MASLSTPDAASERTIHEGILVQKKNRRERVVLSVKGEDDEIPKKWYISRKHEYSFLFLEARIQVHGHLETGEVDRIQLVRVAPDPVTVQTTALELLAAIEESIPLPIHPDVIGASDLELAELSTKNLGPIKAMVPTWIRRLQGREGIPPRQRKPHTSRKDIELLEAWENKGTNSPGSSHWKLLQPLRQSLDMDNLLQQQQNSTPLDIPFNLPAGADQRQDRIDYIVDKKEPQVQWILARLKHLWRTQQQLYDAQGRPSQMVRVVDVGGGRGDLATRIAKEFDFCHVTMVDRNGISLQAAADYAKRLGVDDRMTFWVGNFEDFDQEECPPEVGLVVALHACGDLSDLAMHYAQRHGYNFLVCPCCYSKQGYLAPRFVPPWCSFVSDIASSDRHEPQTDSAISQTLGRLAETDHQPELSRRAQLVINSLRIQGIPQAKYSVSLEEYSNSTSKRNLVLVGLTKTGIRTT